MPDPLQVQEFYRIARSEFNMGGDGLRAQEYLFGLPTDKQIGLARVAATDSDTRISYLGITSLIESCHENETVPILAKMVANGLDLTPLGYSWAHSDDETLAVRMYIKISRYLLAHLENHKGEERNHVERFLSDGGVASPIKTFSLDAVGQRLEELEAKLRSQGTTTTLPEKARCTKDVQR